MKSLFGRMFNDKRTKNLVKTDIWDLITNTPHEEGWHLFSAQKYIDYGYGPSRVNNEYDALRYIGSVKDETTLKLVMGTDQIHKSFMVIKGRLLDVQPVVEKYIETIEKERVVGFKLE